MICSDEDTDGRARVTTDEYSRRTNINKNLCQLKGCHVMSWMCILTVTHLRCPNPRPSTPKRGTPTSLHFAVLFSSDLYESTSSYGNLSVQKRNNTASLMNDMLSHILFQVFRDSCLAETKIGWMDSFAKLKRGLC